MYTYMKPLSHGKNCPCKLESSKLRTQILLPHLKKAFRQNSSQRRANFSQAPPCLIKYASDCAGALLKNQIQLPEGKYKKLKRHKESLHFLAQKKPSLKQKREKLVSQNGAGLGFIIPILATAIQGIVQALS
jgi:hypothetical protein